jgi:hypothetical protein
MTPVSSDSLIGLVLELRPELIAMKLLLGIRTKEWVE